MFKRLLIALVAAGYLGVLNAKTVYVNCQMDDYTKHDGTTPAKAVKTLQEGVNLCAKAGDTVLVAPGDYNHGARYISGGLPAWGKNVLMLDTKQVTIRSTDGAESTFITGQHGSHVNATTGEPDGCGVDTNDFVRCIAAYGTATEGTIIEGFTIRNGACLYSASAPNAAYNSYCGGGIYAQEGGRLYVVDCVISNNVGGSDAVYRNVGFVRSKLVDHTANGPATSPSLSSGCYFINCYVAHNNAWANGIIAAGAAMIINSTFVDNNFSQQAYNAGTKICNSILNGRINTASIPTTYASLVYGDNYDAAPYAVMAPPLDDYRVRLGSGAETMGDPQYFAEVELPDAIDPYVDIDGNLISSSGAIAIGCCQSVVEPSAGGIYFNYGNQAKAFPGWRVDGGPVMHRDSYVFPAPGDVHAFHFEFISTNSATTQAMRLYTTDRADPTGATKTPCGRVSDVFCEADGSLYQMPNLDKSRWICLNQIYFSSSIVYLDAKASQAGADGTETRPFRTFKDAIESTLVGDQPLLLVRPGVYAEGDMVSPYDKSLNAKARIIPGRKFVYAAALEGPETTIIMGAPDPNSDTGCGDDAVRIAISGGQIDSTSSLGSIVLNGFTLTRGYSATAKTGDTTNPTYWPYSGVMISESSDALARNCIISNNVGQYAAAGHWSLFDRCRFINNRTMEGNQTLLNSCYLSSCLVAENPNCARFLNQNYSKSINCTFVGCDRSSLHYESGTACDRYNNLYITGTSPSANGDLGGNLYWNFASVPQVLEAQVKDPYVLNPGSGDARLFRDSPAITNGVLPTTNNDWFLLTCDLEGNPWRYQDGVGVSGASQTVVSNGLYLAATSGGVAIDGQSGGYFELEKGESVTVEYVDGSTRPVGNVEENGEARVLPLTITAEQIAACEQGMLVTATYTNVWYVDAVAGDDANFGYATNNAFRTLQRAMENVNLLAYDKVMAMPGNYAEGSMEMPSDAKKPAWADYAYVGYTVASRAIVPKNVTLESIFGREVTIISGKWATTPGDWVYSETDVIKGMGDDAMHALTLNNGARVKGFTITQGYSRCPRNHGKSPDDPNHADPDFCGGGITAYYTASSNSRSDCWAEDCIISNNASYRGGGVMAVNCKNCLFIDNAAGYGGGAASDSKIYGCFSRDNVANIPYYKTTQHHNGFFYGSIIHNSTMLDGFCLDSTGSQTEGRLSNCLVLGRLDYSQFQPVVLKNCVINTDAATQQTVPTIFAAVSNANHCVYTSSDNLQVDEDYRPILGLNAAIDAGDASLMVVELEEDASGLQRIYNNSLIDVGAFEYDYRPIYTAALSNSKRISITEASPSVYASYQDAVRLPLDARVVTSWLGEAGKAQNYSCSARVSGNGTLIATLNGEELGRIEGSGEKEFVFINDYAANTVVFTYTGTDGYAELLSTGRGGGSLIMCR